MPVPYEQRSFLIEPINSEAITHNTQIHDHLNSIVGFVLGLAAAILGLTAEYGFLFYAVGLALHTLCWAVSIRLFNMEASQSKGLDHFFVGKGEMVQQGPNGKTLKRKGAWKNLVIGGNLVESLCGFVLAWAGLGAILR